MKKLNKAQKIEKMLSAGATVAEVVEKLKVAKSYVYLVSLKIKVRRTKPTTMAKKIKDITAVGTELGGLVLTSPKNGKYRWVRKDPVDTPDMVNHPPHYKVSGIEVIDYIESKELGYHLGNVIKYVSRAGLKDGKVMEDLQKAQWYLNRAIEFHNKYHGSTTSWSVSTT